MESRRHAGNELPQHNQDITERAPQDDGAEESEFDDSHELYSFRPIPLKAHTRAGLTGGEPYVITSEGLIFGGVVQAYCLTPVDERMFSDTPCSDVSLSLVRGDHTCSL